MLPRSSDIEMNSLDKSLFFFFSSLITYMQKHCNYSDAAAEGKALMETLVICHEESTMKTAGNSKSQYFLLETT